MSVNPLQVFVMPTALVLDILRFRFLHIRPPTGFPIIKFMRRLYPITARTGSAFCRRGDSQPEGLPHRRLLNKQQQAYLVLADAKLDFRQVARLRIAETDISRHFHLRRPEILPGMIEPANGSDVVEEEMLDRRKTIFTLKAA